MLECQALPPCGWRGDGTGKYPLANPATLLVADEHGREVAAVFRPATSSREHGHGDADGVIREWLVVGPLPLEEHGGEEPSALPDEAGLDPIAGQEAGPKKWEKVILDSAYLDFTRLVGKPDDEDCRRLRLHAYFFTNRRKISSQPHHCWQSACLGQWQGAGGNRDEDDVGPGQGLESALAESTRPGEKDWYVVPVIQGQDRCEYDESGIAWRIGAAGCVACLLRRRNGCGSAGDRRRQDVSCKASRTI